MQYDPRETPVSCSNAGALDAYERALREYQSYVGDAVATIDRALGEQPDFLLGLAFKAGVLMTYGERRFATEAAKAVAEAERYLHRGNERERGLVHAARRLVAGDWSGGCAAYDRVLVEHPRDAFALQTAHLFDFYRGDSLNLRNRVSRVLPWWGPSVPGWSFVLGMHAFGLEECNEYEAALDTAQHALAAEPRDAWAVHAGVHCMEMRGRIDEGIEWLEARVSDWAPENSFAYHNWWHLALLELDRGRHGAALDLYDRRVHPEPTDLALMLVDATSLLFRLRLLDVDVGERFQPIADAWEAKLDSEAGFYAFNDVHAMMAFAATGKEVAAVRVLEEGRTSIGAEVGVPVARALFAFERGRFDEAVDLLEPVRDGAQRFGGSHAQRDLLTLTLVEAARRAGRKPLALHYLAERNVHRPGSTLGWRLRERLV